MAGDVWMAGAHVTAGTSSRGARPRRSPRLGFRRGALGTALVAVMLAVGIGTATAAPMAPAPFGTADSRAGDTWGSGQTTATRAPFGITRPASPATRGMAALTFALAQVGKPYVWAGAGPDGYDCSGLAMAAWASAGVSLAHYTGDQVHEGTPVAVADLQPGDLVFFGPASAPYHVGLYVSADNGGMMVDAPHTGAFVRVEPIWWSDFSIAVRPG